MLIVDSKNVANDDQEITNREIRCKFGEGIFRRRFINTSSLKFISVEKKHGRGRKNYMNTYFLNANITMKLEYL